MQAKGGLGDQLIGAGYFYFTAHHRRRKSLVEEYTRMFIGRGAQATRASPATINNPANAPIPRRSLLAVPSPIRTTKIMTSEPSVPRNKSLDLDFAP